MKEVQRLIVLKIACVAVVVVTAHEARAAEKTMPIDLVGDWCSLPPENKNTALYALPSWTEGGHCTNILSIRKYDFYFNEKDKLCEPVKIQLKQDVAPSGTAYMATITARCMPSGPVTAGKLQTFEFSRYKGHLDVTAK